MFVKGRATMSERREAGRVAVPLRGSVASECEPCAGRMSERLSDLPGVEEVRLDTASGILRVTYDPVQVSSVDVTEQAHSIARELEGRFTHRSYRIGGMDCANCALSIEKGVGSLPGVVSAQVNFTASRLRVEHEPDAAVLPSVESRVRDLGFTLQSDGNLAAFQDTETSRTTAGLKLRRDALRIGISGIMLAIGLVLDRIAPVGNTLPWADIAYGAAVAVGGYRFALAGIGALKARIIGTHLLMALAAVGAVLLGQWFEAAAVVFLYGLGEALEGAAMERTRRSLSSLLDATPREALVLRPDGTPATVPPTTLVIGDILLVRPGALIAADGLILEGSSSVNEAALTGESLPRDKQPGDTVYAGSVNGNAALRVRVTANAADSTLARVLHLVEEAQAQKAPAQALVERFGAVYTPLVLISALVLALAGPLVVPGVDWLRRALTLLVVACPCALVIATPVAYVSGIARAARSGVLVKGGIYLEALAAARQVAFDKTGTLTTGRMSVTDVIPAEDVDGDEVLSIAAAVEAASDHPLAAAVLREAERRGLPLLSASSGRAIPGRGVAAVVSGQDCYIGTRELLTEAGIDLPEPVLMAGLQLQENGRTVLFVARGGKVAGLIAVLDGPRPESPAVVAELRRLGLGLAVLTGDAAPVAKAVGSTLGIEDIRAGLLPEDKLQAVREMEAANGGHTLFIGDGINDAPALAAASVGVAMGAGGTAAALEAADIALMRDDLTALPQAVRLARATRSVVRQNVAIAVGTVAVLLVSTFVGGLSLPLGVLGHEASALFVILNALRLLSPRLTRLG